MNWFRNVSLIPKIWLPPTLVVGLLAAIALYSLTAAAAPDGRVDVRQAAYALGLVLVGTFIAALVATRPIGRLAESSVQNEQRFRRLVEAAFEGIVIHDRGRILDANEAYAQMVGYELPDLIGRDALELCAPDCRDLVRQYIQQNWEAPYEAVGLRRDGTHFPVEIHGKSIELPSGRVRVAAVREIGERKQAEQALRQQASQLEGLRQVSLELSAQLDLDALLQFLVTRAVELVGGDGGLISLYRPEQDRIEVIAVSDLDLNSIQPSLGRAEGLSGTVFATGLAQVQNDYLHWSGRAIPGEDAPRAVVAVPVQRGGEFLGVLTVMAYGPQQFSPADTEQLSMLASQAAVAIENARLHQRVQQHAEELELRVYERTQELSAANERLKGLDRLKSQFISDVSHELRTPLTNLVLYLDLLERSDPDRHARYMAVIRAKSDQLVNFTEDILRISRLSLYEDEADFSRADLNEIVRHIVEASRGRAEAAGLQLHFTPAPDLPPVLAETNLLAQAFTSLLDNAITYTSQGEITVTTELDAARGQLMVQITDTGMGIGDDDLPHIFDRFYRGRRVGQLDKPGTGLGLSVFKETIDLHGGQVEVASHEGLGTVFRAWLPLPRRWDKPVLPSARQL